MRFLTWGWGSVYLAILIMNYYIFTSYLSTPFASMRMLKLGPYIAIQLGLFFACLYYFIRFFSGWTSGKRMERLSRLASFYISFLHYSTVFYLIHDIFYLSRRFINYPLALRLFMARMFFGGLLIFLAAGFLSLLALINSRSFRIKSYNIELDKKSSSLDYLNIVYISDGHMGVSLNRSNIARLRQTIKSLKPDLVFLGGDFFDEGTVHWDKKIFARALGSIATRYGVFAVEGNHEYQSSSGSIEDEMAYLKREGVRVLRDQLHIEEQAFYLIGRKDPYLKRSSLENLSPGLDSSLPLIVLDHRPNFKEAKELGADLQISGHSHSGQFFPLQIFNPLSRLIYRQVYGHYKEGDFNIVVSSGIGNWGIPARLGSRLEIVNIRLRLK